MVASGSDIGDRIAARLADATLLAPHLLPNEVDSALRGLERGRKISTEQADAARDLFAQFPIDHWPWHHSRSGPGSCGRTRRPTTPDTSRLPNSRTPRS